MKLDEMIVRANDDKETYVNEAYHMAYSSDVGFRYVHTIGKQESKGLIPAIGWEIKPKCHLTVAEAEKELDCIIDVDLPKILKPANNPPKDGRDVIVFFEDVDTDGRPRCTYGKCSPTWFLSLGKIKPKKGKPICWIDPEDILGFHNR